MERRKEYRFGDMVLRYETDEQRHVGLILYPASVPAPEHPEKKGGA